MSDRAEPRERESSPKSDYKDERDRDAKGYAPPSKDYAKDFPPREYPPSKDYARGNSGHEHKIYVGGLNYSATKDDLYDAFAKAGKVLSVQLVVDHETQRSRGYAFVTFADEDAYLYAIERMNGTVIKGRNVVINKALNAEEKAKWERERGIHRDHRDREPPSGRYAPSRPHYNSDRPHFDKPPGPKNVGYRVTVTGLPATYTWRELKDFLRNTTNAQPTYANVERPGVGVGEWATESERSTALRLLNGMVHEGCKLRCEVLEPGPDGTYGPPGGGGPGHNRSDRDDPGYSRGERGRGGGYDDRYYGGSYESGGGGRGGGYDDRYPEKYPARGEGGGRSGGYEGGSGGGRYEGGGGGGRYEGGGGGGRYEGGGGGSRYEGGGYSREGGRNPDYNREAGGGPGGYSSRDPAYGSRDQGYSSREGGRDYGGYGPGGGGGGREGGGYGGGGGGGYSSRDGGGRGGGYDDRYPDKYSGKGGDYGGAGGGRPGGYDAEGGRGGRYDDPGYEGGRREPASYSPPPKDPYSGYQGGGRDRAGAYGSREPPYGGSRGPGGGGREPGYDRGSAPYERAGAGGGGRDAGYDRGYDRGGDGYGYESGGGGGGFKSGGAGGGYSGRAPPSSGAGAPRGGGGGGYAADGYEGTGRGGPDRNYPVGRGAGYDRSAPY